MDSSALFQKYYNKALYFLSPRPRSEKEIREKLLRHSGKPRQTRRHPESGVDAGQASMTIVDQVINKLKEQNLINDEDFAKWWIEQRTVHRPKGIRFIKMELKQKGIAGETIESQISNIQFQIPNELEKAKKLIIKKIDKYSDLPKQEIYAKIGPFLARRGFDFDTIKKSIDELLSERV